MDPCGTFLWAAPECEAARSNGGLCDGFSGSHRRRPSSDACGASVKEAFREAFISQITKCILTELLHGRAPHTAGVALGILHFHNEAQEVRAPLQIQRNTSASNPRPRRARRALFSVIVGAAPSKMSLK